MSDEGTQDLENILNEAAAATSPPAQEASKPSSVSPPSPTPSSKVRRGNEVFNQEGSVQTVSREEAARQQFGFEIPVDAVPLPSAGKVYPEDHPFHNAPHVEYRAMTAREEDILMSQALIKKGTVITELIKSCLVNKSVNVNSLLSGDRNAIMVGIRISGYGREYEPTFVCPSCDHKNEMHIDLANLNIKPLDLEPVQPGHNVFEFVLPLSKKKVEFKFLTGSEEEKIVSDLESKRKRGLPNNNMVTSRLSAQILSADGNHDLGTISKFVNYMPARDSLALREYIDKHEPGIDMEVEFQCTNCEYYDTIQLPMGPSFFWPNART